MSIFTPVLWACALHLTWFHSGAPAHLFGILVKPLFPRLPWTSEGLETRYRDDWFTWVNLYLPGRLAELLTCPVCLSWHIALWCVLILSPWDILLVLPLSVIVQNLLNTWVSR